MLQLYLMSCSKHVQSYYTLMDESCICIFEGSFVSTQAEENLDVLASIYCVLAVINVRSSSTEYRRRYSFIRRSDVQFTIPLPFSVKVSRIIFYSSETNHRFAFIYIYTLLVCLLVSKRLNRSGPNFVWDLTLPQGRFKNNQNF